MSNGPLLYIWRNTEKIRAKIGGKFCRFQYAKPLNLSKSSKFHIHKKQNHFCLQIKGKRVFWQGVIHLQPSRFTKKWLDIFLCKTCPRRITKNKRATIYKRFLKRIIKHKILSVKYRVTDSWNHSQYPLKISLTNLTLDCCQNKEKKWDSTRVSWGVETLSNVLAPRDCWNFLKANLVN